MNIIMYFIIGIVLVLYLGRKIIEETKDEDVIDMLTDGLFGTVMASILSCVAIAFWPIMAPILLMAWYYAIIGNKRKRQKGEDNDTSAL